MINQLRHCHLQSDNIREIVTTGWYLRHCHLQSHYIREIDMHCMKN